MVYGGRLQKKEEEISSLCLPDVYLFPAGKPSAVIMQLLHSGRQEISHSVCQSENKRENNTHRENKFNYIIKKIPPTFLPF